MASINLNSEIGKLKSIIVHEPGNEIELITPHQTNEQNFLDIVHYEGAKTGHDELRGVLSLVAENAAVLSDRISSY